MNSKLTSVSPLSEKWGYRLGSIYIRKVAFTDVQMVENITEKVVKRLVQVTSAMKQDGENRVGLIKSETAKKVSHQMAQAAAARDLDGYVITLDLPSYLPVMQYAADRALRETLYRAYVTRASELGPGDGSWDKIACDYVLTEYGGTPTFTDDGTIVLLTSGEKRGAFRHLEISGEPGHGSMPYGSDNALIKAATIVHRMTEHQIAPRLDEMFRDRIRALGIGPECPGVAEYRRSDIGHHGPGREGPEVALRKPSGEAYGHGI